MQGDGSLAHETAFIMPARLQDQVARCNVPIYQLPVGSEQKSLYEALQLTTAANFQSQVAQPDASGYQLPVGGEHGVRHS